MVYFVSLFLNIVHISSRRVENVTKRPLLVEYIAVKLSISHQIYETGKDQDGIIRLSPLSVFIMVEFD